MFLILGGNGYVGSAFQKHLKLNELPFEVISRSVIDYSDEAVTVASDQRSTTDISD